MGNVSPSHHQYAKDGGGFGVDLSPYGGNASIDTLRKALGMTDANPPTTGGDALRVQSLDNTLKNLSYKASRMRIWSLIKKKKAFSTVEEYNRLNSYGSENSGFVGAAELPQEEDTDYSRETQSIKYIGTTRSVQHPATMVRSVPANLVRAEVQAGTLWMIGRINQAMYYGDSAVVPEEWDGVVKQAIDGGCSVIDMDDTPVDDVAFEEASDLISQENGMANCTFANHKVFSDFSKVYYERQRFNDPGRDSGGVGVPMRFMNTQDGKLKFEPELQMKSSKVMPTVASSTLAPSAPTGFAGVVAENPTITAGGGFKPAYDGDYEYAVTAVNKYGESAPFAHATTISITDVVGDNGLPYFDSTVTFNVAGELATGFNIYRTKTGGTTLYLVASVGRTKTGSLWDATTDYNDINENLPDTFTALVSDMNPDSCCFLQLSPLFKMDLAIVDPRIRWMQLMYATPVVYAPKKHVIIKNIGKYVRP